MASGYIHISRKDIVFDNDNNVVYWKNGGRYLGEIAKAVLNPGEETEVVKYYLKSAVTKKAILIDAGVVVGGGDYYFITDDANFINARIETADFSSDGGGDGVTVTFLLPESKYYTVYYVEENGDIKIYDPDGDAGTLVPDALPDTTDAAAGDALVLDEEKKPVWDSVTSAPKYMHNIKISKSGGATIFFKFINSEANAYTTTNALKALYALIGNTEVEATGFDTRTIIESIKPTSAGTCTVYGTSLEYSNNAISFTQDDSWNLSNMTGYTCTDTVYEI